MGLCSWRYEIHLLLFSSPASFLLRPISLPLPLLTATSFTVIFYGCSISHLYGSIQFREMAENNPYHKWHKWSAISVNKSVAGEVQASEKIQSYDGKRKGEKGRGPNLFGSSELFCLPTVSFDQLLKRHCTRSGFPLHTPHQTDLRYMVAILELHQN